MKSGMDTLGKRRIVAGLVWALAVLAGGLAVAYQGEAAAATEAQTYYNAVKVSNRTYAQIGVNFNNGSGYLVEPGEETPWVSARSPHVPECTISAPGSDDIIRIRQRGPAPDFDGGTLTWYDVYDL